MTPRPRVAAVVVTTVLIAVAGCGSSSDGHLSTSAQQQLQALTDRVRSAAEAGDRVRTQQSLAAVRAAVARDERTGEIGASRAQEVLADVTAVQSQLALLPAPTTTTTPAPPSTPPSTPPRPPPPAPRGGDKKGNGNGPGPGKGNKHRDQGDPGD